MTSKGYTVYRNSELPWINRIPAHWQWIRNRNLFVPRDCKVGNKFDEIQLLSLTTQGIKKKDIWDPKGKKPASYEGYQQVKPNDLVFCLFDLDCSAVFAGLSHEEGMITSAYDVLIPNLTLANPAFLEYWFISVFSGRYYKIFSKTVRFTVSIDNFMSIKTPLPSVVEQNQVVRYLNWKTSEINEVVNGYQKQLKLLEEYKSNFIDNLITHGMEIGGQTKHSKADWMGSVPSNWKEMRVKDVCKEVNNRSADGKEPHLSMSQKKGLVTDDESINRPFLSESYIGGKICQKDDLVLNRLKAHLGVFALAPMTGVVSPDYTVLKIDTSRVVPKYLELLLRSKSCRRELAIRVRGITEGFWRLYTEDLYSIPICIPSLDEQQNILEEIAESTMKIDKVIQEIYQQVELLKEYRKSLISSVVTGQINVQDISIPEYEAVGLSMTDDNDYEIAEEDQDGN